MTTTTDKREIHEPGSKVLWYVPKARGRWYSDSRISIGILFFADERDAVECAKAVRKAGNEYNGGWFQGKACGREKERDYTDDNGVKWFAVTH